MRAPPVPEALEAGLDLVLVGLLGFFLLRFLVIAVFLIRVSQGNIWFDAAAWLLLKPFTLLATAALLIRVRRLLREAHSWLSWGGGLLVFVFLSRAYLVGSFGTAGLSKDFAGMLPPLAFPAALALARRRRDPLRLPLLALGAMACGACVLALRPSQEQTRRNALGLASFVPGRTEVYDHSSDSSKDHYPVCRCESNSLGFRDAEPPAAPKGRARRVLIVGDSFVWGDGIPSNEETLGSRLRAELEVRAPGRYLVMSAAYPGLGLYGYDRFIDALVPRYQPDLVVVGYLGESDHDPFDAQAVLDRLPSGAWLRNLVLNLGAAQHLCEASVMHMEAFWRTARNAARFARLREDVARKAAARGTRLVFLCYFGCPDLPEPIEALELTPRLRYPGHSSELWYAKDYHPKPELDRILAADLAAALVSERPRRGALR